MIIQQHKDREQTASVPKSRAATSANRNVQLDVLRALAIVLVIFQHLELKQPEGMVGAAARFLGLGGFGVPLFFALSGYLVGGLLLSEYQKRGSIAVGSFLLRRGLKIYPAYFVFIVYLIAMPVLKARSLHPLLQGAWEYLPNLLFLNNYIGSNPAGHTWSLAVEEHFYLTLPLLILLLVRLRKLETIAPLFLLAPLVGTLLRLVSTWVNDPSIHRLDRGMAATHLWFDGLLVGLGLRAIAGFQPELFAELRKFRYVWLALGVGTILVPEFIELPSYQAVPVTRILPIAIVAATLILTSFLGIHSSEFGPLQMVVSPTARALAWIGKYSYGIYLWHVTLLGFAGRVLVPHFSIPGHASATWLLGALVSGSCAVLFGAFMSRIIEWPVLRLRDRHFPSRA